MSGEVGQPGNTGARHVELYFRSGQGNVPFPIGVAVQEVSIMIPITLSLDPLHKYRAQVRSHSSPILPISRTLKCFTFKYGNMIFNQNDFPLVVLFHYFILNVLLSQTLKY